MFAQAIRSNVVSGYAQAQDRLKELMRNYRKAQGTMAEAFGPRVVPA